MQENETTEFKKNLGQFIADSPHPSFEPNYVVNGATSTSIPFASTTTTTTTTTGTTTTTITSLVEAEMPHTLPVSENA